MLVILSDLHLNDGTTGATISAGAFQVFLDRLREMAWRASWRADGKYRPLDHIDLVLLGDVLDVIRSQRWLTAGVRPWHDSNSPQVIETTAGIVDDILRCNADSLQILRAIAVNGAVSIPQSSQSGQPMHASELRPISVRTFYMVGNHDWQLHVRGAAYDAIRHKVIQHLGLANSATMPFPHDPTEGDELFNVLRRHRVMARHGDIFDPLNFNEDRSMSSIGDAIVIELLGRFSLEMERRMASDLPAGVLAGIREIDNLRPLLMAPVWIEGLLERACSRPAIRKEVKRIWDSLADEFLNLTIVRDRDSWSPFDLVDGLQQALKFSKRVSIGWASKISTWLLSLRGASSESYFQHALAEPDFRNRRARNIIYGHTHAVESLPLDASFADGYVLNQMYFNSGTWRRVYRPTQWAQTEHEFIPSESMSYVSFFQGDERSGRPFETWSGTLGINAGDQVLHRLDSGRTHASEQSIPAPNVPVRAPHFRPATAPSFAANSRTIG